MQRIGIAAAWLAFAGLVGGAPAEALTLASNTVLAATSGGGVVQVDSRVDDNVGGDVSRWLFTYELSGSHDPLPGSTNGLSGLALFFGGLTAISDQAAPTGWVLNCCIVDPPFGASFDIDNSTGSGVTFDTSAIFSFTVPAGTPFTAAPQGSAAYSHLLDVPFSFVDLVDDAGGHGPIVPVPEPASVALVAAGLAWLARRGRAARA